MTEVVLPGTYITVRDEGLISAGRVVSGYIGIVGTAERGPANSVQIVGSFSEARQIFGEAAPWSAAGNDPRATSLTRSIELAFNNGARTIYAVRAAEDNATAYGVALEALAKEIVNIVLIAGHDATEADFAEKLQGHIAATTGIRRERIAIIGAGDTTDVDAITAPPFDSDRLVYVAPGLKLAVSDPATRAVTPVTLPGSYLAAAVAGLIASLPVQASPTNKTLTIGGLNVEFTSSQLEKLVQKRVLAVEKREGFRVVKGITTAANSAWHQITTRRIVDYAIYGVRSACNPYIGKLNNTRVRGAMKATIDSFLTRMVGDEALVGYTLEVSATRPQEIAGEAMVTMTLQPTFSIDFVKVTMYLG